jgi:CheY-like chemotaxis protein
MTLSSMVVSSDWQEVSVLECILGGLHIVVDVVPEAERAWQKLAKSKVDALIVDCDLEGADTILKNLQQDSRRHAAVPLVITSSLRSQTSLAERCAAFAFEKPISVEQAVRTLSAARNLILDGRLRYHRQALELPVTLAYGKKLLKANLINLSQGGMGIQLAQPVEIRGSVQIVFELPGNDQPMRAQGEVAWTDQRGHAGIRFGEMSHRLQRGLQLWLEQQYFIN